ncbi:hypothetical protein [Rhodopila globiformis]|uniref:Uncharacterized protein n=1 Tax=Rhodopila globiformis TaxID=1071 RepID=A0A2S6NG53_RHOGL|nr:hypothetical protein [Rhodopila globiformis]PPQ33608.1 hypothetical protein CCS01_14060 [Rhodopila globiformis]
MSNVLVRVMIRIGDRAFLFAWQAIRAATQPGPEATSWEVAGVRWRRHRYSNAAPDHAVTIEVHRLDCTDAPEAWSIMVVAEHWWDQDHKPLRNNLWATHLSGSKMQVAAWIDRQAKAADQRAT